MMWRLSTLFLLYSFSLFAQSPLPFKISKLKTASDNEKLKLFLELSQDYTAAQPDSAVYYANRGLQLAQKQSNWNAQAVLLLQLGRINAAHHHDGLARRFYNEALSISRHTQDVAGIANAYDELGLLDAEDQDRSSLNPNLTRAMKLYHSSSDSSGIIESYAQLGKVYEQKGEAEKALSYYQRALAQYERQKIKPEAYFILLEDIGNLYMKKGKPQIALTYLQEGINNSRKAGLRDTEVSLLNEEGIAYQDEGQQTKALSLYKNAFESAKKYKQPEEEAKALINIASVLQKQNSNKSLADLKEAMRIARTIKQPQLEARILEAMAGVYRQEQNYKEAMNALSEQHRLLDSLLQADTAKDIAALDSSYALETSYEKIGALQQTNKHVKSELQIGWIILILVLLILVLIWLYLRKIKRLNQELKASNKIKDTLFSVIGHDLKGPAASAVQLFEMMETEEFTAPELKGMIIELKKQTNASLELLKSLFAWGKAQLQGIEVNKADFLAKELIDRCITLLAPQASQKNITIKDNAPANLKVHADADHFEFVIRNLLSNAIKFSHPGGIIEVEAKIQDNNEAVFSVSDHGVGITKAQQHIFLTGNLSTSFGTAKEKGSGLGLLLTKDFLKANNGQIWLKSRENEGSTFYVSLPAA
ncbi:MAG: ATP-binding protein [Mucilaginibacter sp.]